MSIERVDRFVTNVGGVHKEFKTPGDAIEYRESLIEQFMRRLPGFDTMAAKKRIPFMESLLHQRHELMALLDYHYPPQ